MHFYPRSPCGERLIAWSPDRQARAFLSTLSLRRATTHHFPTLHNVFISIHALLAESDIWVKENGSDFLNAFLSTLSLRRATQCKQSHKLSTQISIHALLAESDCPSMTVLHCKTLFLSTLSLRRATVVKLQCIPGRRYFYPRSPCGERPAGR